ncbi:predicted protein [Sclerotinia sclerotiorum 1980 UF-70]|uniref:Uncharacterized protein n=1 Tax=Sclerotinia sclerotiorum (strain ATCC 18683 / 1980 / Ss-1) TaxID=665079 RepID=A7EXH4_SCLS1|nr:predicted protein [Sclerotinia sclerotiorum 1980 UF-70]EDN94166.1 predicted protein [Sclerotinia sclerotiorum 1980 UF-70]
MSLLLSYCHPLLSAYCCIRENYSITSYFSSPASQAVNGNVTAAGLVVSRRVLRT